VGAQGRGKPHDALCSLGGSGDVHDQSTRRRARASSITRRRHATNHEQSKDANDSIHRIILTVILPVPKAFAHVANLPRKIKGMRW
jgi:hypothetical protein